MSRSLEAFKDLSASQQKLEYFLLSVAIALFAYLGKDYEPSQIGFDKNTFELVSLLFLFFSILFGYLRAKTYISVKILNFRMLHNSEEFQKLNNLSSKSDVIFNNEYGVFLSKGDISVLNKDYDLSKNKQITVMNNLRCFSTLYSRFQVWSLILGIVFIMLSKVVIQFNFLITSW